MRAISQSTLQGMPADRKYCVQIPLPKITNLKAKNGKLTWLKAQGASSYLIEISQSDIFDESTRRIESSQPLYVNKKLGKKYVRVIPVDEFGVKGEASEPVLHKPKSILGAFIIGTLIVIALL